MEQPLSGMGQPLGTAVWELGLKGQVGRSRCYTCCCRDSVTAGGAGGSSVLCCRGRECRAVGFGVCIPRWVSSLSGRNIGLQSPELACVPVPCSAPSCPGALPSALCLVGSGCLL